MTAVDVAGPLGADATVAIVGASLAGFRAAETLRAEGFGGRVVLVGAEPHLPYDRPPMSKQVLAGTWQPDRTRLADDARLGALGLDARWGCRVERLDAEARRLTLDDGTEVAADAVVLAPGATPRRWPGTEGVEGVHVLRTLEDSLALRRAVTQHGAGARVVVIGAGFIGSEVASTCAGLGAQVTMLEALAVPLGRALGEQVGSALAELPASAGVELRTGAQVRSVGPVPGGTGLSVELGDGSVLPADVVVVGIGVTPEVGWLEGSGLVLDDGIRCDAALFAADAVVAAGDAASWLWHHDGLADQVRIEHWQVAAEAGVAAARSLLAGRRGAAPFQPVPYFWSDQFGVRIQMLGRPSPGDDVAVVDGALAEGRFVAVYGTAGRLRAAVGVARPRSLMGFRALLEAGASFDDALGLLAS